MKAHTQAVSMKVASAAAAVFVAFAGSNTAFAFAGDDQSKPNYAPVEFETTFKYEQADRTKRIQPVLEKSAVDALQHRHGIEVVESAEAKIVLNLVNLDEGPKAKRQTTLLNYGLLVQVEIDGEVVGDASVTCMDKGEAELVDCAIEGLPAVFKHLPRQEAPAEAPPPTPSLPVDNGGGDVKPDPVAPIGGWGIAGIVVGAGGLATAIAGGVYLARGKVKDDPNKSGRDDFTDFRPPGRALLGVGLGALVVGVVMIAADVGVRAKKRKKAAARFQLDGGPGFAGASLRGRF